MKIIRAVDLAFSSMKTAWFDQAEINTAVVPSVVGIGHLRDLGAMGLGRRQSHARPHQVAWSGYDYLVGENVHRHTDPIEDLGYSRLAEGLLNRALVYSILGASLNGQPTEIDLMVCLPVEITGDRERSRETMRALRSWLRGGHQFSLDGRPVETTIGAIKAVAQPVGAYLDWGMTNQGDWLRDREALQKPVGVCDIGFLSVDLFGIEGAQIVDRYTAGAKLGMHRVARAIRAHLMDHYDVTISLAQADALMRDYVERCRVTFSCAAGDINLAPVIQQALEEAFTAIQEFVVSNWGNGRQFYRSIFTGGGAAALRGDLLRRYPLAYIPPDPVTSGVRGALKRAGRVFS